MYKKLLGLAVPAIIALAFLSCTLPSQVQVKAKPQLDLPVNPDMVNLSELLLDNIKKALGESESGISVLDYVDGLLVGNKAVQTFLIHYSIEPDQGDADFDFLDQLELADNIDFDMDGVNKNLEIGGDDLSSFLNMDIEPIEVELDLAGLFSDIEDSINDGFSGMNLLSMDLPVGPLVPNPGEISFNNDTISLTAVIDEAEIYSGDFYLTIKIGAPSSGVNAFSGANVTLDNIAILDKYGVPIVGKLTGFPAITAVTMDSINTMASLVFDLGGRVVNGNFQMRIGSVTDNSTINGAIKLEISPETVDGIQFKSVTGLKIYDYDEYIDPTDIELDLGGENIFVQAEIGQGSFTFEIDNDPVSFEYSGFVFNYEVIVSQDPHTDNYGGGPYAGLNSDIFSNASTGLAGKRINPSNVNVETGSKITLTTPGAGAFFRISNESLDAGKVSLSVVPKLEISNFAEVKIDVGDKLDELKPDVPAISLDDAVEYLKYIEFNRVGVTISFGEVTIPDLQIMISEPNLGINPGPVKEYKDITSGASLEFINETAGNIIFLQDGVPENNTFPPKPVVGELNFEFDVKFKNGNIITLQDLDPSNLNIKFEMGDIGFISDWEKMCIDLDSFGSFEGSFPGENDAPIDLSELDQYLNGFEFDGLDAYLYINGPSVFFEKLVPNMNVDMSFTAKTGLVQNENLVSLPNANYAVIPNAGVLDLDPENTGEFRGNLPANGIYIDLSSILNNRPSDLHFDYKVFLNEAIIHKDDIDSISAINDPLKLDILLKIPMKLSAGLDGANIQLSKIAEGSSSDNKDILGRDDSSVEWVDWLRSLNLKLELNDSLFSGGYIYLDDGIRNIQFPLNGKTLNVPVQGDNLNYVNNTVPWNPEIGISFPPGKGLEIPRNLGVVRISFKADFDAKFDTPWGNK